MTPSTGNFQFAHMSGRLLFQLPARTLDAFTYFGIWSYHKDGNGSGADSLSVKRWMRLNWEKAATIDGFLCYAFANEKVLGLSETLVRLRKGARGHRGSSKNEALIAVVVICQADRDRADITAIRPNECEYRGLTWNQELNSEIHLNTLFHQDLL